MSLRSSSTYNTDRYFEYLHPSSNIIPHNCVCDLCDVYHFVLDKKIDIIIIKI